MFGFSTFLVDFRIRPQNCTSRFHNLSNWILILAWDTFMSLWFVASYYKYLKCVECNAL